MVAGRWGLLVPRNPRVLGVAGLPATAQLHRLALRPPHRFRPRSCWCPTCPGLGDCQGNMRSQIVMASVMPLPSAGACSHVRAHSTEDDPNDPTRSHHASTRCRICLGVSELIPPVDAGRCQDNKGQLHQPWRRILPQRRRVELQGQTCNSLVSSQSKAFCSTVSRDTPEDSWGEVPVREETLSPDPC